MRIFKLRNSLIASLALFLIFDPCLAILDAFGETSEPSSSRLPKNSNYELHDSCLKELRRQMNMEKQASLVYKQMAAHFSNVNVARAGFAKLFDESSKEESEHSDKFINYINLRGSDIGTFNITMPIRTSWRNALEAVEDAIELEHQVTNEIYKIHRYAEKVCQDVHLMNFLENDFIDEQIASINKFMKLATLLKSVGGEGYGEYLIDRDFYHGKLTLDQL